MQIRSFVKFPIPTPLLLYIEIIEDSLKLMRKQFFEPLRTEAFYEMARSIEKTKRKHAFRSLIVSHLS